MKTRIIVLVCSGVVFFAGTDHADGSAMHAVGVPRVVQHEQMVAVHDPVVALVKKKLALFMRRHKIPGAAIALYTNGHQYLFHSGYADKENKIPVTEKTVFEIGSVTKLFTCLLVAQEVRAGTMCLTDSIRDYIPALAVNRRLKHMTLERLATHTSTLPFNVPESINTKNKFMSYLLRWRMSCVGSYPYLYSNPGIELLRCALEETTACSFQDLVLNRILLPLGMNPIGIRVPGAYRKYRARCYDKAGALTTWWSHPLLLGSAALRASSADMLAFLKAAIGLPGTPESILHAMRMTQTSYMTLGADGLGLGWSIRDVQALTLRKRLGGLFHHAQVRRVKTKKQVFKGDAFFEKTGTTEGFHAYIAVMPNKAKGIVVMVNRTMPKGWNVMSKMGRGLLLAV